MESFRKFVIRLILLIFVLATVGVVVFYVMDPKTKDPSVSLDTVNDTVVQPAADAIDSTIKS